ncbi:MAG TPA: hypothetical protein VF832_02935, partial [Longimicrobiales bacterium]
MRSVWSRRLLPAVLAAVALPVSAAAQQGRPFLDPALKYVLGPEVRQAVAPGGRFDVLPSNAPLPLA